MAPGVAAADGPAAVGSLVQFRGREWIVERLDLAHQLLYLNPLYGTEAERLAVYWPAARGLSPAEWQAPTLADLGDFAGGALLRDAARIALRSGAGPLRSLGQVSVRPRPYQLVPLIMALRLDPVRLLIADDVGIGKTIEAGLIAKELLERGTVQRVAVLCPPPLCEQWHHELQSKFGLDAVVVRSSTIRRLEDAAAPKSVFSAYPHLILSTDFVKGDRYREAFLAGCPDLVIVDEAHGVADPGTKTGHEQQQRHRLVAALSQDPARHLLLLTATPHSGVTEAFASLMGLLHPDFQEVLQDGGKLDSLMERRLAQHLIQRRRADVRAWLGDETPFPVRESLEVPYQLSSAYDALYQHVWRFTRELVREAPGLSERHQRVRYWAALALLRSVMSSPAAAAEALSRRLDRERQSRDGEAITGLSAFSEFSESSARDGGVGSAEELDTVRRPQILDVMTDELARDDLPIDAVEEAVVQDADRRRLLELRREALALQEAGGDRKLGALVKAVGNLLREGGHPIVFCRFVATAHYVQQRLQDTLGKEWRGLRVLAVTGQMPDEERARRLEELVAQPARVLVATDCLSEGIDLQTGFDAVVHYDLPWNPNRLEQREGRVDRYGQIRPAVQTVLLYGQNNPIDAAVLNVLIKKARAIFKALGITVPVPADSEAVVDALVQYFFTAPQNQQLTLDFGEGFGEEPAAQQLHIDWDRAAERERQNRSRFAQHRISPEEVAAVWKQTEEVLGSPRTVARFLERALSRWEKRVTVEAGTSLTVPAAALGSYGSQGVDAVEINTDPHSTGPALVMDRTHPWVRDWAERVLRAGLGRDESHRVARAGAIVTDAVGRRTVIALGRLRYLMREGSGPGRFAEEVMVTGYQRGRADNWRPNADDFRALAESARPVRDFDSLAERQEALAWGLGLLAAEGSVIAEQVQVRVQEIEETYRRLRGVLVDGRVHVRAYAPDWLGVYVLVPGGSR